MWSLEQPEVLETLPVCVGIAFPLQTHRISLQLSSYKKPRRVWAPRDVTVVSSTCCCTVTTQAVYHDTYSSYWQRETSTTYCMAGTTTIYLRTYKSLPFCSTLAFSDCCSVLMPDYFMVADKCAGKFIFSIFYDILSTQFIPPLAIHCNWHQRRPFKGNSFTRHFHTSPLLYRRHILWHSCPVHIIKMP